MLKQFCILSALLLCGLQAALADTIQLKDKAALTGKILAEKRDQVVVDVGYTVLVVPRNQVAKISKGEKEEPSPKPVVVAPSPAPAETKSGLYQTASTPLPARTVRELVNQVGEAVVQVRTPGGLGSGFIINEDGYLITNFHVIEGETQISVEVYHQRDDQLERKVYKQVSIVAMNKFQDLALLRIEDKE